MFLRASFILSGWGVHGSSTHVPASHEHAPYPSHSGDFTTLLVLDNAGGTVHELDHTSISLWAMTFCLPLHVPLSRISGIPSK